MKAVADTLAVACSNLIEQVSRRAKSRRPYRKAGDDELLALIHPRMFERSAITTPSCVRPGRRDMLFCSDHFELACRNGGIVRVLLSMPAIARSWPGWPRPPASPARWCAT
jgi:hypothetical protein